MRSRPTLTLTAIALFFCAISMKAGSQDNVENILDRMTLEEKVLLVQGTGFGTNEFPHLGIPALGMNDGPHGVRQGQATAFPTGVAMGATWNPDLIREVGRALGRETLAKGNHILLGPMMNLHRQPFGGRNFETFSEDPHLTAEIAAAYIEGVQAEGVATSAKHYAVNNQEYERHTVDMQVDERALREVYLAAFRRAVKEANPWTVMAAYNKVNGYWCTENEHLLSDLLKGEWSYDGIVMSDWGATHSVVPSAMAGLDLEMPRGEHWGSGKLLDAVNSGEVPLHVLDDKVRRILRTIDRIGMLDGGSPPAGELDTPAHRALARQVAEESIVLLKNDDAILPLDPSSLEKVALIGPNAEVARMGGGGSSFVTPLYSVSPHEGIAERLDGLGVELTVAAGVRQLGELPVVPASVLSPDDSFTQEGLKGEYFDNEDFDAEPAGTRVDPVIDFNWGPLGPGFAGLTPNHFSVRWTGKLKPTHDGSHRFELTSDDGSRLWIDGELKIDNWGEHAIQTVAADVTLEAGRIYDIRIEFFEAGGDAVCRFGWELPAAGGVSPIEEAVEVAREADVVLLFCGFWQAHESEGWDRPVGEMHLPEQQEELIQAIAAVNPNTVLVLTGGNPVDMRAWVGDVRALLHSWYPGQEGGRALARILFGDVAPSGRLPMSFPARWEDAAAYGRYPGTGEAVQLSDGLHVGYRHFDKNGIDPLFPFGHGLSYTEFEYSGLEVSIDQKADDPAIVAKFDLKNAGPHDAEEVAQLYLRWVEAPVERPVRELRAFGRVNLAAGATQSVELRVPLCHLQWFDTASSSWKPATGELEVQIGASARDIRLTAPLSLGSAASAIVCR